MYIRIFHHYLPMAYLTLVVLEAMVLIASVPLVAELVGRFSGGELRFRFTWGNVVVHALVLLVCSLSMGVYTARYREGHAGMLLRTVVAYCLLGTVGLSILDALYPPFELSGSVLVVMATGALLGVTLLRYLFFNVVDDAKLARRVLIYGAGRQAAHIVQVFRDAPGARIEVVGCIAPEGGAIEVSEDLLVDWPDEWVAGMRRLRVSEIVVALDERRRGRGAVFPLDELLRCKVAGINVTEPLTLLERELGLVELNYVNPGWMLFSDGFRNRRIRDFIKRGFDITISVVLLSVVWPLMLLAAVAVVLESGLPVLYSQQRVGRNGRVFRVHKFRSMVKDAEKNGEAVWAQKNDARVTRVGSIMRNTRIDELPQVLNVLKGDMSFVGPRPERPEFVDDLTEKIPYYQERHQIKPGLMGWAQLNYPYGATVEDAENKLRYDLYYVKNHSFLLDLIIVVQTVEVILLGKGAQ